ncbi:superoxide dismutase [Ectropis obliqua nucleopolyhedrovirus]|uniref:superoxide dismutase n=1 Tax=Ectropis obliqua nucleopolyhedrovirus TaxID=59376 RepID=A0EZ12_9ABAC|nr:superoxide dismutase [Ectropis obliqua nucleopolyhedrovirus]ABI35792.1 superoxide dismutase [Ectropis obliqua nucleopolyhedrovirus]AGS47953.1 Cu/Zn superoxide dismutase P [Ectropis obliqua nucleopolyhedrovirus]QWV59624.1 superoxide dismutase [Ectropis obliqua nucleopolyhedrovirus]UYO72905.1 superoxide dismutase [Ectropis obliqua nucleopolyhedrovirus]
MVAVSALCVIRGDVTGQVTLYQHTPNHPTQIEGYILNLPRGKYGFHIHEYGDMSNGCTSAGEHYNPYNKNHGGPNNLDRHVGDLGNIESVSSTASTHFKIISNMIMLQGPYNVVGRSMVVHAQQDDLGQTDNPLSKTTGNSGGRIACGIIGYNNKNVVPSKTKF